MVKQKILKFFFYLVLAGCSSLCFSQSAYQFQISTSPVECQKASANLHISGIDAQDTVTIVWSNGQTQVNALSNLEEGAYSVQVNILHKVDTTLYFTITKEPCPVSISNQFTPNGDGYNDVLIISNIANFPNFELEIFDRWGQRVHFQKSSYTPWDGKWLGIHVPVGTYYYIFFYDAANKSKLLKGDINILR